MIRLGYPTQNLTLRASTNRTLRLSTMGNAEKISTLVHRNLADLEDILRWNARYGFGLFRMGQSLIPFASHPAFPYDWQEEHARELRRAGSLAGKLDIRLSMHPGQYIQPGSPDPAISRRSIDELRYTARIFSMMGLTDGIIVLHAGGAHGDLRSSARRFVKALCDEEEILRHLALENDERIWTVEEVVDLAITLGVPAITDNLHHALNPGSITLRGALDLSLPTWEVRGTRPKVHLSSQAPGKQPGAHAYAIEPGDWTRLIDALDGRDTDVMLEAKGKERSLEKLGLSPGMLTSDP
ncbi:UV DNA damage repair endonuclease UvsE [Rubrobacter calidifluminis]|uniref:UV DNA damage repair endonuclease UvsE n=1 Tax=Rubrobacter calidifluminis TaxID=1392640 RepID=UPI002360705A|nr:UV DNA damage repair endonuclease UvsE [Rubrobacter calidifluminis]